MGDGVTAKAKANIYNQCRGHLCVCLYTVKTKKTIEQRAEPAGGAIVSSACPPLRCALYAVGTLYIHIHQARVRGSPSLNLVLGPSVPTYCDCSYVRQFSCLPWRAEPVLIHGCVQVALCEEPTTMNCPEV